MPDLSKYDLEFRPKTYGDLRDVLTFVEARITGKERKGPMTIGLNRNYKDRTWGRNKQVWNFDVPQLFAILP